MKRAVLTLCVFCFLAGPLYGVDCLEGDCTNGSGSGRLADGTKYNGEWKGGLFHGRGTATLADGTVYIGNWQKGRYHGLGTLMQPSGEAVVGEFREGGLFKEMLTLGKGDLDEDMGMVSPPVSVPQAGPVTTASTAKPAPAPEPVVAPQPETAEETAKSPGILAGPAAAEKTVASPPPLLREVLSKEPVVVQVAEPVVPAAKPAEPRGGKPISFPGPAAPPVEPAAAAEGGAGRYPEGSRRLLSEADLQGKSRKELRIMRNEIFARHGYIFSGAEMTGYFGKQSWYEPRNRDVSALLSQTERQNIEFVKQYEQKLR